MKLSTGLAVLFLAGSSFQALAAATPEEAARLTAVMQSYVGSEPGVVTVTPNGDSYNTRLDFAPLIARIKQTGFTASVTPIDMTLTPQGNGKWKVDQDQPLAFSMKVDGQIEMKGSVAAIKGSGIFDEALGGFESSTTEYSQFAFDQTVTENNLPTRVTYTIGTMTSNTAMAAAGSGADGTIKMTFKDFNETISVPAAPDGSTPAMDVAIAATDGAQDSLVKGLQTKGLLGLAAWLVAHPSPDAMKAGQAELKDKVYAALPIFTSFDATTSVNNLTVNTMMGRFAMARADVQVIANGLVEEGYLREKFTFTGFKMPDGIVPPWAAGLVPGDFTIDFDVSDFNLAAAAKVVLDNMDLTQQPSLKPEIEQQALQALLPKGSVKIGLLPSTVLASIYNLKAEGAMTAGPMVVTVGQGTVLLKGLDEAMAAMNAAPPEMGLQQLAPMFMLAKGMAKQEADGYLSWKIEGMPDGAILINGTDLSKIGGAPPSP